MKYNNILETVGNTPHVIMNKMFGDKHAVWIKMERANPGGSIKDRIALSMVEDAEECGILKPGGTIIEPTSGNTGIGLAMVAAVKGYKLILVMPESMSVERRKIMAAYGADFELTPKEGGMKGAIAKANELLEKTDNAWMPQQFENEANVEVHRKKTAEEILQDFPGGIDYLITGVGTGGHITGVAEILKKRFPNMKVFAVEPDTNAVLSGNEPGPNKIQGIGAGFVPDIMKTNLLDGTIQVSADDAFEFAKRSAKEEAVFCGNSSGATLSAINQKLPDIPEGSTVLGFNYDTGERYLSVPGLFELE